MLQLQQQLTAKQVYILHDLALHRIMASMICE